LEKAQCCLTANSDLVTQNQSEQQISNICKISVVIPTLNSSKTLEECLSALQRLSLENSIQTEIIIIDAGSTDDTILIAEKYSDKIIVSSGITRGAARNLGAASAKNNVYVFLDSDCVITEDWIEHLRKTPLDIFSTVIAGPVVLAESNTLVGSAARDLLSSQFFTLSSYTFSVNSNQKEVEDIPSSNILISKNFFNHVGGFPDLNFNEDGVFCKRILAAGGKIVYFPDFKVNHKKAFTNFKKFCSYFFQYGRSYGKNLKQYPGLMNRYGMVSIFFAFCVVSVLTYLFLFDIDITVLPFFLFTVFLLLVLILSYSFIRFKKRHAGLIPLLFITLTLSYIGGFYYGFFDK
jgi:glycosyltransferase involved in cell wall biosynthesis